MTEQQYLDSIAIYNPRGGNRPARIYDIRDTTHDSTTLLYTTWNLVSNFTGGGTREFTTEETNPFSSERVIKFTGGGTSQGAATSSQMYNVQNFISIIAKAGTGRYLYMSTGTNSSQKRIFDLVLGTVNNTQNSGGIDDLGNGWYRCYAYDGNGGTEGNLQYGVNASFSGYDMNNTGLTLYLFGINIDDAGILQPYARVPKLDLTVTGGGGTRFLADGSLEEVKYYNRNTNSNSPSNWSINDGITVIQSGAECAIKEDTSDGYHYIANSGVRANSGINTIEVKKVNWRYVFFAVGTSGNVTRGVTADLDTGTLVREDPTGATSHTFSIADVGDGWFKITVDESSASSNNTNYSFGFAQDTSGVLNYIGDGSKEVKFRKAQSVGDSGDGTEPYQVNVGSAAFPKIDYGTGSPAFLIEPQRLNRLTYSYDVAQYFNSTATLALNEVGITGEPNTATTITDSSTTAYEGITLPTNVGLPETGKGKVSVWLKKATSSVPFTEIVASIRLNAGGTESNTVRLNTFTGEFGFRNNNDSDHYLLDRGDWWEVVVISTGDADLLVSQGVYPTFGETLTGNNTTSTGSVILGHVSVSNSSVVDETPIITNGAIATRTHGGFQLPIDLTDFEIEFDIEFLDFNASRLIRSGAGTGSMQMYVQTQGTIRLIDGGGVNTLLATVALNERNTLTFIKQNGVITTLKNGVQQSSFAASGTFYSPLILREYAGTTDCHARVYSLKIK